MRTLKTIAAVAGLAAAAFSGAFTAGSLIHPQPVTRPAVCVFDGGGEIASGDIGRTSDGKYWACSNGALVQVVMPGASTTAKVTGIDDPPACAAAYHLHHVTATGYRDEARWQAAYRAAQAAAAHADPALQSAIDTYLRTGKRFSWIAAYCAPTGVPNVTGTA
jgi:hypothetical protein